MRAPNRWYLVTACLALLATSAASADQTEFKSSSAGNRQNTDCSTRAGSFEPFTLGWLVDGNPSVEGGERSIRCTTSVHDGGQGRKGVKVTLEGEVVDLDGNTLASLGSRSGKTDKNGYKTFEFPLAAIPAGVDFLAVIEGDYSTKKKIDSADTTCTAVDGVPCEDSNETVCLLDDNRFKVDVEWSSGSESGSAGVSSSSKDTGTFYFFNPNNQDLLVRLLDACSNNNHFWVFYSATTSVDYTLTVTDTETGSSRVYDNELGQAAPAITDTSAFATCP